MTIKLNNDFTNKLSNYNSLTEEIQEYNSLVEIVLQGITRVNENGDIINSDYMDNILTALLKVYDNNIRPYLKD